MREEGNKQILHSNDDSKRPRQFTKKRTLSDLLTYWYDIDVRIPSMNENGPDHYRPRCLCTPCLQASSSLGTLRRGCNRLSVLSLYPASRAEEARLIVSLIHVGSSISGDNSSELGWT
jgi:hypothetical protein